MDNISKIFNNKKYITRRQNLRIQQTEPEKRFWQAVRGKQLGTKFRRQHGIGHYIVDFYCAELALIIELDGNSHFTLDAKKYDTARDTFLTSIGLTVMRFTNQEIMQELEAVLKILTDIINLRLNK